MDHLLKFCGIILSIFMFASLSSNAQDTILLHKIGSKNNTLNNSSQPVISKNQELSEKPSSVNIYPYMRDLDRRIRLNWNPPRGKVSNNVVTFFTITKDGKVTNIKILESSGSKAADDATVKAISDTQVYPLPEDFAGDKIDVKFTFHYTIHPSY